MKMVLLWGLVGASLFWLLWEVLSKAWDEHALEQSKRWMLRRTKERMEREQGVRLVEGEQQKDSFLYRLDLTLVQSGIARAAPWFTTEVFIALECVLISITILICLMMGYSLLLAIVVSMLVPILSIILLYFMSGISYQRVEKEIVPFMNLLENYSKTNDDVIKLMELSCPFLEEPIHTWIQDFCHEAGTDGDTERAFRNLLKTICHPRLRELIRNLELCSLHEANYAQVIRENRESIQDYLGMKEERRAIRRNGRIEILLLLVASGVCLMMFGSLVQDMEKVLLTTLPGNLLLGYCGFVVGYAVFTMLSFDRG